MEILVNNRAISKLIKTDQSHQIPAQLQTGKDLGMQLMDQALLTAIEKNEVDPDDAFRHALDKRRFSVSLRTRRSCPRWMNQSLRQPGETSIEQD